jgi:hypothetical protein
MRPGALTQAARTAAAGKDVAGAPRADRRRTGRTAPDAPGERKASRPPRRVSGPAKGKEFAGGTRADAPAKGKEYVAGTRADARTSRPQTSGGTARAHSAARAARAQSARASRLARTPIVARASGSAAGVMAAAVALPLRPFVTREPAPRTAPARRPTPVPKPAPAKPARGIPGRIGAFVLTLPDHPFLDRVVRGRGWIPLLGVLLAGIVAAQVEILKLGASMGRSLEQTTTLTSQNEQLRGSVAALSDDQRIERLATNLGMVLPPPGAVGYLTATPGGEAAAALNSIHAPDANAFMDLPVGNGALVTGAGTSVLPTSSGLLAQAGTPGSATPTTTPSPTTTVPSPALSAATSTTSGTATTQAPPAEQPPPATATTTTTGSQTAPATTDTQQTDTSPTNTQQTDPQQTETQPTDTQTSGTGAGAIQPAGEPQQGTGG